MVNLFPKQISAVFKGGGKGLNKTWTGLLFIIKNNDLPAIRNKLKKTSKFPGERFCLDMKNCPLLFTLTIEGMLRIDKVRARTLFSSVILLQKTYRLRV